MLSAGIMLNGTERRRGGTYVPHAWINIAGDNLHNDFFFIFRCKQFCVKPCDLTVMSIDIPNQADFRND